MEWAGAWLAWGKGRVHTGRWGRKLMKGDDFEDLGADGKIILKWIFKK
jgi:hypothetical protein